MDEKNNISRCSWPGDNELMVCYHDTEWGVPLHDDVKLFEFLVLDTFQAGLSWSTVLKKRKNFCKAFSSFNANKIAKFGTKKIEELILNPGIIRNRLKIQAVVQNAKAFLEIQECFGSFDQYIWRFVDGKTIQNCWKSEKEIPAVSKEAEQMSKDLKRQKFQFVGPVICYAFMQAAGLINDHIVDCFRYSELSAHP